MSISVRYVFLLLLFLSVFGCGRDNEDGTRNFQLANDAVAKGNIIDAFNLADKAILQFEEENDFDNYFRAVVFLSSIYHITGQGDSAFVSLKELDSIASPERNLLACSDYYRLMAYYTAKIDSNYDKALHYSDILIRIDKKYTPNDSVVLYSDLNNRVEILICKGDYDEAYAIIDELENNPCHDSSWYMAQQDANKAILFYKTNHIDSALLYANKVLSYQGYDFLNIESRLSALDILIVTDSMRNDLDSYIKHKTKYDNLAEEYRSLGMKYHTQIVKERNDSEALMMKEKYQHNIHILSLVLLICVVLIVLIVMVWLYRNNKYKRKMAEQECKRLDVEIFRKHLECELLHNKVNLQNEKLSQSEKNIIELSRRLIFNDEANNGKSPLLRDLENTLYTNYSDFVSKIKQRYPKISDNELLILGGAKIGWSTKDIAIALNISQQSLVTARYRLRKKLGLKSSEELTELIISL